MKEKGYDLYTQVTGYIMENEPTYITNHGGARQLITTLDIECVKQFVKEMR
ncbi:MAG: IreB family regulatory phosphoprotein [Ruminococcaceae bacterium]|nr:IreB family regulatory phosphoprotein [Oscillospiraceae bacterium]